MEIQHCLSTFKFHFGGSLWGPTLKDGANLLAPACIRLGREPLLVQLNTLGMKEDADRRSAFVGTITPKLQQCVFHRCIFVFSCVCLGGAFSSREGCKQSVCQAIAETTAANTQTILQKNTAGQHQKTPKQFRPQSWVQHHGSRR